MQKEKCPTDDFISKGASFSLFPPTSTFTEAEKHDKLRMKGEQCHTEAINLKNGLLSAKIQVPIEIILT